MKIASIYNDVYHIRMNVIWDENNKEITYHNADGDEVWSSNETAETLQDAIDDTYARYCQGWELKFEKL